MRLKQLATAFSSYEPLIHCSGERTEQSEGGRCAPVEAPQQVSRQLGHPTLPNESGASSSLFQKVLTSCTPSEPLQARAATTGDALTFVVGRDLLEVVRRVLWDGDLESWSGLWLDLDDSGVDLHRGVRATAVVGEERVAARRPRLTFSSRVEQSRSARSVESSSICLSNRGTHCFGTPPSRRLLEVRQLAPPSPLLAI